MALHRTLLEFLQAAGIVVLMIASGAVFGTSIYMLSQQPGSEVITNVLSIIAPVLSYVYAILHGFLIKRLRKEDTSIGRNAWTPLQRFAFLFGLCIMILWAVSLATILRQSKPVLKSKARGGLVDKIRLVFVCLALLSTCILWGLSIINCSRGANIVSDMDSGSEENPTSKGLSLDSTTSPSSVGTSASTIENSISSFSSFKAALSRTRSPARQNQEIATSRTCSLQDYSLAPSRKPQRVFSATSLLPPIPRFAPLFSACPSSFFTISYHRTSASANSKTIHTPKHSICLQKQQKTQISHHEPHLQSNQSQGSLYSTSSRSSFLGPSKDVHRCLPPRQQSYRSYTSSSRSRNSSISYSDTSTRSSARYKSRLSIMSTVDEPPEDEGFYAESQSSSSEARFTKRSSASSAQMLSPSSRSKKQSGKTNLQRDSIVLVDKYVPPVPKLPDLATLRPVRPSPALKGEQRARKVETKWASTDRRSHRGFLDRNSMTSVTSLTPLPLSVRKKDNQREKGMVRSGSVERNSARFSVQTGSVRPRSIVLAHSRRFVRAQKTFGPAQAEAVEGHKVDFESSIGKPEWRVDGTAQDFATSVTAGILNV